MNRVCFELSYHPARYLTMSQKGWPNVSDQRSPVLCTAHSRRLAKTVSLNSTGVHTSSLTYHSYFFKLVSPWCPRLFFFTSISVYLRIQGPHVRPYLYLLYCFVLLSYCMGNQSPFTTTMKFTWRLPSMRCFLCSCASFGVCLESEVS
jgi:hypothetical protein